MAIFDRMLDAMNLGDDDEYYDEDEEFEDDDYYDDDEDDSEGGSFFSRFKKNKDVDDEDEAPVREKQSTVKSTPKITPMRSARKATTKTMEVCVIKPTSFEDAREISETLLADRTVILNMEGIDLGLAQRIIDFTSGCCYAIDGNLQKISNYIFIITPAGVDISGDLQGIVDAFDFAGIQTGF
ncbi:MAG: cell division protein SepF [Lachnospiraceae bacterium]|nr:cell division protein SepF [Lachnospiraceae bacterium]